MADSRRHNTEAEEAALGAMLRSRDVIERLTSDLTPEDFYLPKHGHLFSAMLYLHENGFTADPITVADRLRELRQLEDVGGASYIVSLETNCPAISSAPRYSGIVRREANARRADVALIEGRRALAELQDPADVAEMVQERLGKLDRAGRLPDRYWRSTRDYLDADKGEAGEPVVRDVIAARSRTILLGSEKAGKSVLLRQLVMCIAAGLHPFTFKKIDPVPCLIVDAENDDDELERTIPLIDQLLATRLGPDFSRPALFSAPYRLDLRSRRDRSELEEVLEDCRPRLIVGGPVYKIIKRRERESEDDRSGALQDVLDGIRRRWGSALIIEHHTPTESMGKRAERSKGGQQWDAWVNATIFLRAQDEGQRLLVRYPHPPRGKVVWPRSFDRATRPGEWPWEPRWDTGTLTKDEPPPTGDVDDGRPSYDDEPGIEQEELF